MEQEEDTEKEKAGAATGETAAETDDVAAEQEARKDVGGKAEESADEADKEQPKTPDWKEQYARAMADFDNFRKRTSRDREDLVKFAAAELIKDMLPTADTLALALSRAENKDDPFVKGVQMAYDAFIKALADHGATPIDSVGEPFDANYHEAIAQLPSDTVDEGRISAEAKRGWLLNGRLLRAAQVVVSAGQKKGGEAETGKSEAES